MSKWAVAFLLLFTATCAIAELTGIPLQWRPTTEIARYSVIDITGLGKTRIQLGKFTEDRKSPRLIGQNWEDVEEMPDDRDEILPVTARDSVARWCRKNLGATLEAFGLNTVAKGGTVILSGKVRKFFVKETFTYDASVSILITLTKPDGKVLWQGVLLGAERRFGGSYEADNYYEVLSDALQNGTHKLLMNAAFRQALR